MTPGAVVDRLSVALDFLLLGATAAATLLWFTGAPLFYTETAPVLSIFTSLSLFLLVGVRLARRLLEGWPTALSLALIGIVMGGNVSGMLIQGTMPPELMRSFNIVLSSALTSAGLCLFSLYELLITLRATPRNALLIDDILLHLALAPGGLSLLGLLFNNPLYLSEGVDPRIGISPFEMALFAAYAVSAAGSNRNLFLWEFLAESWSNRLVFAAFFANQFIAPLLVGFWIRTGAPYEAPGPEAFVLLAGVIATTVFLSVQAYLKRREQRKPTEAHAP